MAPRSLRLSFSSSRRPTSGPPSPTFSDTTNASRMDFGPEGPAKIITRANLKASIQAYEELLDSCSNYRRVLITLSQASSAFADAMERCSGLKGPTYETGSRLQAASGLHHLIANHWHVLSETLERKFEKPLRQHLETYRVVIQERSMTYERAVAVKSRIIHDTEQRNMNKKERNLQSFREALMVLQRQVDDLDDLKAGHYREILEHEEEVWDAVQGKVCLVVRSTMDVFDRFTAKASDPVIEPMLQSIPDPFDSYGPPQAEDQIFSILPPLSLMSGPSTNASPLPGRTPELRVDGLPSLSTTHSWPDIHDSNTVSFPYQSGDESEGTSPSTSPRSISPSSPLSRRHTSPTTPTISNTHHPRKAESKLRSVLSVIDESQTRQNENSSLNDYPASLNGTIRQPKPERPPVPKFSWTSSFSYGQKHNDAEPDEAPTPRNSSFQASQLAPPSPAPPDKESDDRPMSIPVAS